MWTVWRKEKEEQTAFFPYRAKLPHEFAPVYACVVKYNECVLTDTERKPVDTVSYLVGGHILGGGESFIPVIAVYHAENVESHSPFGRNVDILTAELPSVWHISLGADVALISIIKVYKTVFLLLYELLQLLGLILIELRRGFPLWTFPYTLVFTEKF